MERETFQTVDVVKSRNGVMVYSTLDVEGLRSQRSQQDYKSWEDVKKRISSEVRTSDMFDTLYGKLKIAEKGSALVLSATDILSRIGNEQANIHILPILGIIAMYAITKLAKKDNVKTFTLSRNKLVTVMEAVEANQSQYQHIFPLGKTA